MRPFRLKRVVDVVGALVGLAVFSVPMLMAACLIHLTMGRPILFRQLRPGLHGKPFVLYKFRTMLHLRDEQGNLLPDDERLTRLGRLIRQLSLDEIPEPWNVLKGDMRLVGTQRWRAEFRRGRPTEAPATDNFRLGASPTGRPVQAGVRLPSDGGHHGTDSVV